VEEDVRVGLGYNSGSQICTPNTPKHFLQGVGQFFHSLAIFNYATDARTGSQIGQ